jgi:hypothetical protein
MILGKLDGTYACADEACRSDAHDIVEEDGLYWLVACAFCGTIHRVQAIRGHIKPKEQEFRFSDGRFSGATPAEAAAKPNGMVYLRWAAVSHKRPAVRAACQKHLDSASLPE